MKLPVSHYKYRHSPFSTTVTFKMNGYFATLCKLFSGAVVTGMCAITELFTQYNYEVFSEIMPLNADLDRITHELGFLHAIFKYHRNTSLKYLRENIDMVGPVLFN